ncbi:AMP-binding protein [Leucobacter chromiireducens]|uniref:AMP-binding protein n=1 Tax=Leucobacter chromiireducens TaxID=283877 RepID=UPI000F62F61C|nr:AMP-binding protein [Leucobacter chromiireducens]
MKLSPSAYTDTFARDMLPPQEAWPRLEFTLPELQYPDRLNAAAELIDVTTARYGAERSAILLADGTSWSYGELQRRANQVAHLLTTELGLVPGNRVFLRMANSPWAVACWLGTLKAGGIVVTTMTAWKSHEVGNVLAKVRPAGAFVDAETLDEIATTLHAHVPAHRVVLTGEAADDFAARCDAHPAHFTAVQTAADDVALFGATSGTTGSPKVTMHFHRDILANADTFATHTLRLTPDDVSASTAPLAFTFGLGGLVVFPLRSGGAMVLLEKPGPLQLAEVIDQLGITVLYTAPTGYRTILKEGYAAELSHLRIGVSAGEHLPPEVFAAVEEASGLRLVNGIGSTEMLHVFVSAAGDEIRPGATGRAVPGYRATILDDTGAELGPGEAGHLAVIGPTGCRYLDDERQADYVRNGWNVTGDTYVRDADGYFTFQARSDSIIVTAGYNVGAPEVEEVISTHPGVLECAVIGRPDPDKGVIVSAYVVPRAGTTAGSDLTNSILAHVKDQLAIYKCPRRIDYLDALPRNPSGKVQHFVLRERAASAQRDSGLAAPSARTHGD